MTIARPRSLFLLACLIAGSLGLTASPAAAQPLAQRFTLDGMWADVRFWSGTASATVGSTFTIYVDLVPHSASLPLRDRRLTLDLTPLGYQRTTSGYDTSGDGSTELEVFGQISVYAPPGDVKLRFTASADLGRGGTFELPLRLLPATDDDGDTLPDVWEGNLGLSAAVGTGVDGPDGDPDGDGLSNREEFQHRSHPRGLYTRYFPEGGAGDFFVTGLDTQPLPMASARLLVRTLDDQGLAAAVVNAYVNTGSFGLPLDLSPRRAEGSFAQIVESDVPFTATRSTTWPSYFSGYSLPYGSHASEGTSALSTRWLFAEGVTGPFDTYLSLVNPSTQTATVTITYVGDSGGPPVVRQHTIGPERRATIAVDDDAAGLASTDVAFIVDSSLPIAAERSIYRHVGNLFWGAGTSTVGAPAAATAWYFAEGLVNPVFDSYLLLLNPGDTTADVSVEVLRTDGLPPLVIERTLPPQRRVTVHLNDAHPALAGPTSFGMTVRSTNGVPIVAERTMWWDDPLRGTAWVEGHTSVGVTEPATRWSGGGAWLTGAAGTAATYLLLANPGDTMATVRVSRPMAFGTTPEQTVTVPPRARVTLDLAVGFTPDLIGLTSSVLVESLGPSPVPIVVERSSYASTLDATWTVGSSTPLTPLP